MIQKAIVLQSQAMIYPAISWCSRFLTLLIIGCGALFPLSNVFAHGGGASIEKTVGSYLLDIGYDPETFRESESVRFDFGVYSATSILRDPISFTDVWVRVSAVREGARFNPVVFAGNIYAEGFGPPGMTYVFPKNGSYELTVRFQNNGVEIAETSVPITVASSETEKSGNIPLWGSIFALGAVAGMCLGSSGVWFFKKRRS